MAVLNLYLSFLYFRINANFFLVASHTFETYNAVSFSE
ncbi:50S ribosomal protein L27 [Listeria monocytogenes]|nr:50S ribosomal protein L27 [Listeria monocytogenes]